MSPETCTLRNPVGTDTIVEMIIQAQHKDFSARARDVLRSAIARLGSLALPKVSIEGVRRLPRKDTILGISVRLSADVGPDISAAGALAKGLRVRRA